MSPVSSQAGLLIRNGVLVVVQLQQHHHHYVVGSRRDGTRLIAGKGKARCVGSVRGAGAGSCCRSYLWEIIPEAVSSPYTYSKPSHTRTSAPLLEEKPWSLCNLWHLAVECRVTKHWKQRNELTQLMHMEDATLGERSRHDEWERSLAGLSHGYQLFVDTRHSD